ncbi:protein-L-isoaspartate O-methyltransferase family protein [Saccharothrix obliqua]|uniref:protein-L-isoaspartate O-methyltransferase family protein n=1 Tax=Saccharothrix obliqua TaxID=2861747 RepID=UPI0027E380ED|nr:methyltransferase domain-containing protein [Saccharothrix obliqua]
MTPTPVVDTARAVPGRHYSHHPRHGTTAMRSNPDAVHRELTSLDVRPGMTVLEIGTGSGYSGALLAALVGPHGRVVSIDVDPRLVDRARALHRERGVRNVDCLVADGLAGHPDHGPYHRVVAWCTPPLLPATWTDHLADDARLVTPLPIAELPHLTAIATITVHNGHPAVVSVHDGGYMETLPVPGDSLTPTRWIAATDTTRHPPAWISTTGHADAHAALRLLLDPPHTEHHAPFAPRDWVGWRTWAATAGDPHLATAGLGDADAVVHTTTAAATAALTQDGDLVADSPDSPAATTLRERLRAWNDAGRPPVSSYTGDLTTAEVDTIPGRSLRLTRARGAPVPTA